MRFANSRLLALRRRALGSGVPDQHAHPPQRRMPGPEALAATAHGPCLGLWH